jgi:putative DNA primase/helicase
MGDDPMFAPLDQTEMRASLPTEVDEWRPMLAPNGTKPDFRHQELGDPSAVWTYTNAAGELEGYVCRFDSEGPDGRDKEFRPRRYGRLTKNGRARIGWHWKGWGEDRPLYGLGDLLARPSAPVLVVEGEKAADTARRLFPEYVGVSPMYGAKSPHKTDWAPLAERGVVVWPDHDASGLDFAKVTAELAMNAGAASMAIVSIPESWPEAWDLADVPPHGISRDDLAKSLESARPWVRPNATMWGPNQGDDWPR